ncbi:hypothetical protein [Chryseobacterium oryctis]|uniref:Uncharacterized protein n=1 Tax=Chryseobacterium oryctis TaxID=2952618 RepID=A0ABT3HP95_9FLAO|nr:hypothetical protein [Chryseobacterium oryctis]MCW3161611.1 hypothetical protein [Chryseobacterium oryctis]
MKSQITLLASFFLVSMSYAQVGISTNNPLGAFHVDGGKDNKNAIIPNQLTGTEAEKNDFIVTQDGKVGVATVSPTQSLDVNGKARVRSLDYLGYSNAYPVYADENGVLGKAAISPSSKLAFFESRTPLFLAGSYYNGGNEIKIPITNADQKINTIGASVYTSNNYVRIGEAGTYIIGGSINFSLIKSPTSTSETYDPDNAYIAINIKRSSDGGASWESVNGARPIFPLYNTSERVYSYTLPISIVNLNVGDLIKMVFYRTVDGSMTPQGTKLQSVGLNSDYGIPTYTLSFSKNS